MPLTANDHEAILFIAQRSAQRDLERTRETLLRMAHEWRGVNATVSVDLAGVLDSLERIGDQIAGLTVEGAA